MTVGTCPHGCGGFVTYGPESAESFVAGEGVNVCPSCRRHVNRVEIPHPLACWAWHGPTWHRMRCRLPRGHEGEHDCGRSGEGLRAGEV